MKKSLFVIILIVSVCGSAIAENLPSGFFSKSNHTYVIDKDYDLRGAIVKVPQNCVLSFEGGSMKNGTISAGNSVNIVAPDRKIFDKVSFTGGICLSQDAHLEWFVGKYVGKIDTNSPVDSYPELVDAFNCGLIQWSINTGRYYYLSKTLVLNKWINITNRTANYSGLHSAYIDRPCFYSDKVATLVQIPWTGKNGSFTSHSINLDGLNLRTLAKFDTRNPSADKTAVLDIYTESASLWGCNLNVNISGTRRSGKTANGKESGTVCGFTGLSVVAKNDYVCDVKVYGSIYDLYCALNLESKAGQWNNQVDIYAGTWCVLGLWKSERPASHVFIHGEHQPFGFWERNNDVAYFEGDVYLYGFVWDLNVGKDYFTCTYALRSPSQIESVGTRSFTQSRIRSFEDHEGKVMFDRVDAPENASNSTVLALTAAENFPYFISSYDVGGKQLGTLLSEGKVENVYALIGNTAGGLLSSQNYNESYHSDFHKSNVLPIINDIKGMKKNSSGEYPVSIEISKNPNNLDLSFYRQQQRPLYISCFSPEGVKEVNFTCYLGGKKSASYTVSRELFYYFNGIAYLQLPMAKEYDRIVVQYNIKFGNKSLSYLPLSPINLWSTAVQHPVPSYSIPYGKRFQVTAKDPALIMIDSETNKLIFHVPGTAEWITVN